MNPATRNEPSFKEAVDTHKKLVTEWNKPSDSRNMEIVAVLLEEAKGKLANMKFFLPNSGKSVPRDNLLLARDILEIGAFFSVAQKVPDMKMFERYMSQLKTYYFDYGATLRNSKVDPNVDGRKYELLSANLLFLLTEERIAQFHTELELILHPYEDTNKILANEYVSRAVEIGKCLEEGRYNAIWGSSGSEKKSFACQFFVNQLIKACRIQIGETLERAYTQMSEVEACKRLHFTDSDSKSLQHFAKERHWKLENDYVYFNLLTLDEGIIPADRIMLESLDYARELEKIV